MINEIWINITSIVLAAFALMVILMCIALTLSWIHDIRKDWINAKNSDTTKYHMDLYLSGINVWCHGEFPQVSFTVRHLRDALNNKIGHSDSMFREQLRSGDYKNNPWEKKMNILYDMLDHGTDGNIPKLIVIHAMGEFIDDGKNIKSARDFLDAYGLSAHVLCKPDGDLIQCRSEDQVAWHARGHNQNSLGIEILVEGNHNYNTFLKAIKKTNWPTDNQMISTAAQVREWMHVHNIGIDKVVRHSDLSPDRKVDPGSGFNWVKFKKMLEN